MYCGMAAYCSMTTVDLGLLRYSSVRHDGYFKLGDWDGASDKADVVFIPGAVARCAYGFGCKRGGKRCLGGDIDWFQSEVCGQRASEVLQVMLDL